MKAYPYGHDYGNAESDGVTYKGNQIITRSMPTIEAIAPEEKVIKNLDIDFGENTVIFKMINENTSYIIGEGAFQIKGAEAHRGYINRYTSDSSLRALLANAASMIPDQAFRLHVVTGVPVTTYKEDTAIRDEIINKLSGHYEFLLQGKGGAPKERHIDIVVEKVVAEGAGVIIGYGSAEAIIQAVIDLGGRTLDLYVSKGQKPQLEDCRSYVIGVEAVLELLTKLIKAKYNYTLKAEEARAIYFANTSGGRIQYPHISVRAQDILIADQSALCKEAINVIGNKIKSNISSAWSQGETSDQVGTNFKQIFLAGRGTIPFRPFIEPLFSKEQFKLIKDPGPANAIGYATLARKSYIKALNKEEAAS